MSLPSLPLLRPGQTPSAEDWNRLVAHLSRTVGTVTGLTGGDIGMGRAGGGIQVFDGRAKGHWARLTGEGDPGFYAHRAVVELADGTFEDLPEDADNPHGGADDTPAIEVNGVTGIPTGDDTGTVVWVWPDETTPGWRFQYAPRPTSTACGGTAHQWAVTVVGSPSGSPADYTACLGVLTLPRAGDYLIYFNAAGEVATVGAGYSVLSVTVKNAGVTVLGGRVAQWYASETPSSSTLTEVGGTASGVYPVTVSGGDLDVYLYGHLISSSLGGAELSGSLGYVPLSDATVTTCDECEDPGSGSGGGGGDLDFYCFDLGDDVTITLSNVLGDCTDLPETIELTRYTGEGAYPYDWRGTFTFESVEYTAMVRCPVTINPWGVTLGLGGETVTPVSQDEDTNTLIWDLAFGVGSACIGSARLTIVGGG